MDKKTLQKSLSAVFFGRGWRTVTRGANCAPWSFAGKTRRLEEFSTRLLLQVSHPTHKTKAKSRDLAFWQGLEDLNPRHSVLETDVLPTELNPYEQRYYTKYFYACQGVFAKKCEKYLKIYFRGLTLVTSSHYTVL